MNVIVLDYQENFITFLDNDLLDITEHYQIGGIRYIDVEYYMQEINDARNLFRIGNKIWIQNDNNLTDCLYVINSEVKRDYFKKNNVTFTAEDVIVELNYAPFFKQTDITSANGFTLSSNAGEQNVKVDYKALNYWFGDYFNIGIVQNTLNSEISKISPKGTMTKMELLRYIEEQTCNIFIPRYEKDINSNVIHRFLDYLNPNSNDTNWAVTFKWEPVDTTDTQTGTLADNEDVQTKDDIITLPPYIPPVNHDPSNIVVSLKDDQDEVIDELTWNGETDLGMDGESDVIEVTIKYNKPTLSATVNNRTLTTSSSEPEDRDIDSSATDVISFPAGKSSHDESNLSSTVAEATLGTYTLPSHCYFEVYDSETNTILYRHKLNPVCGDVHSDVLDLAYNVENIEYTLNEEDTFTAISPKLKTDGGTSNALTYEDYSAIINNWINLSVNKGDKIPMIIERMTVQAQPTDNYLSQSTINDNYYARPLKPNDNSDNNDYEYWKATAYWTAPFTKVAGEMYIEDPEATGVEYNHIQTRPDITGPYGVTGSPKMGIVETSDENKYAIYNDVATKLKDKRYPTVKINVDVANYKDGKYNDYNIYDKVFVKVPGYGGLITAIVEETTKKAHDIGKNTIALTNFSVNTKVATKATMLFGDNVSYDYPKTSQLDVTLKDIGSETEVALNNKLINMTVYKLSDSVSETYMKTYTKTTNANGMATLPITLAPGNYIIRCDFPGDVEYSACSADFHVNSSGTIDLAKEESSSTSKTTTKTTTTTRYYNKYGRSPDNKYILAIGRPSAAGEVSKYGYKFYETQFKLKCPHCGSTELYWSIFWAGNETSNWGKFPATGRSEGGSAEGHIFCKKCDADWSVFGKDHGLGKTKNLTVTKSAKKTTKTEAYNLKNGKVKYDTVTTKTTTTNNSKTTRNHTPVGTVNKTVKEWALKKVGSSEGAAAAKKLAVAVGKLRYDGYANFVRSPQTVLSKGGGNCCDQARLLAMACDLVGVTADYNIKYVHVCCSRGGMGHVFLKLVKKSNSSSGTYMDPTHNPYWNTYLTGWGSPPGRQSTYPKTPF